MEKRIKNAIPKKKNEFRYHSTRVKTKRRSIRLKDHPTYVFMQEEDKFKYVQITHSKKIKKKSVVKLRRNPNPDDDRDSFYIKEIFTDIVTHFGKKRDGWKIDKKDERDIRKLDKEKR